MTGALVAALLTLLRASAGGSGGGLDSSEEPDYGVVFPADSVLRIDLVFAPETWRAMLDDMTSLYGELGEKMPVARRGTPDGATLPPGDPIAGSPFLAPPPEPLPGIANPSWFEVELRFGGEVWEHVGVRFKGGSSLAFSWSAGILKLPMKLDFDRFEEIRPETRNPGFHGFRQLTLSSGFMDPSLLRERVTADIFREAGVPAARTAFCRVYVDCGEGPVYFGLYTLVEVVEDTVIRTQLVGGGAVYQPEGPGGTFAAGSFSKRSFDLESRGYGDDWSPVVRLHETLHSGTRLTRPAEWRAELESVLDVDRFLTWLAVSVVVQNWDSYGRSPHNYYLYADPVSGRLTWIPWDHNMALGDDTGLLPVLTPDLGDVGPGWPLIRFLIDDPVYRARYLEALAGVVSGPFDPVRMEARYRDLHGLIEPFVTGPLGERSGFTLLEDPSAFDRALEELIAHGWRRSAEIGEFLGLGRGAGARLVD